jgi:hypothetical protein
MAGFSNLLGQIPKTAKYYETLMSLWLTNKNENPPVSHFPDKTIRGQVSKGDFSLSLFSKEGLGEI